MFAPLPMLLAAACSSSDAKSAATPAASAQAATAEGSSVDLAASAPPPAASARTDASADLSHPPLDAPVSSALDAHSSMADALLSSSASATPHDPLAGAAMGGASISGGSISNAAQVIAGQAAGFRRCYQAGLKDAPTASGTVKVTARIGPNGEVLSATPWSKGTLPEAVVSCVAARVRSMQFANPDGGSATIVIPISFATAD